jgi:hypothetical protein
MSLPQKFDCRCCMKDYPANAKPFTCPTPHPCLIIPLGTNEQWFCLHEPILSSMPSGLSWTRGGPFEGQGLQEPGPRLEAFLKTKDKAIHRGGGGEEQGIKRATTKAPRTQRGTKRKLKPSPQRARRGRRKAEKSKKYKKRLTTKRMKGTKRAQCKLKTGQEPTSKARDS